MASFTKLFQRSFSFVKQRGIDVLRDPRINKGTAFNLKERQLLGIHGLLPPGVNTMEEQALRCMINLRKIDDELNRHLFLISLQDRNEDLFYKVVTDNVEYCLPIIYTPTVGLACQKYGLMFRRPRGLYITIHDKMYIKRILDNWPEQIVKALVVSDGERILGLGDLGAYGMGIPVGKLSLYTALAGVPPSNTLPVLLDVGTDNQDLLDDPLYLGVRHKRIRGKMYFDFMDAFMQAVVEKYGRQCLIQFEDFANINAFRILSKYRNDYCTFNDDIQGTASVTIGGLLGACKIANRKLKDNIFLFQGAGSAATGIALLLKRALIESGASEEEAISKIYMFDIDGLLVKHRDLDFQETRSGVAFSPQNTIFVKDMKHHKILAEAVKEIKPTVLIGAAGVPGVFNSNILNMLTTFTDRPIVFALSNPTSKSECTATEAYTHTDGKCIYACGSPFAPVHYKDKVFIASQCNNSYIFPGIALAIIMFQIRPVTEDLFIRAAETLAKQVSDEDLAQGRVFPALWTIKDVSLEIAVSIAEYAYSSGIANHHPEPKDKREYILKHWYNPTYLPSLPNPYKYPQE